MSLVLTADLIVIMLFTCETPGRDVDAEVERLPCPTGDVVHALPAAANRYLVGERESPATRNAAGSARSFSG